MILNEARVSLKQSESKVEADPEKNQARYNLRRRKEDEEAKPVEAKQEQLEEKDGKLVAAPAAPPFSPLDFGGKIGRL